MLSTSAAIPEEQHFVLSNLPPSPAHKRLALAVVLVALGVFAVINFGPLNGVHLRRVDPFVPAYVTAMFVNDLITAILLFAHFSIVRWRSTLVIASGYLFSALILIPFLMVFPGVFAPGNLIGGLQSTSFLWLSQHGGFALFVIGYALSKDADPASGLFGGTVRAAIVFSVTLTAAVVVGVALVCIAGSALLPQVAFDDMRFSPLWLYFIGAPLAILSAAALVALGIRRRSVIDLWLMVVMFLYLIETSLSYYPDPIRFSVGWYAVRVIGFFSSSLILIVLLHEISTLYARLVRAVLAHRREREVRLLTGDAVAASIAHEVRQPLTAMITTADAGLRFLDRAVPNLDKAKEAFRRIVADGHRAGQVVGSIRATFRSDLPETTALDVNELIQEALLLARGDLQKHSIVVKLEIDDALPQVAGNRVQLQQVLLNLINNAVDATASVDGPRMLSVKSETDSAGRVLVSVADTGSGISSQEVDRIFAPLYTTKSDGMGMGLSICRGIIEAHKGRLWFSPNRPRGTVFHFTLQEA